MTLSRPAFVYLAATERLPSADEGLVLVCDVGGTRLRVAATAEAFAIGVFNLVHCFSPEVVVIGGGMSRAGDLLLGPVRERLGGCGNVCPASHARVVRAEGGDDVGLLGGLAYWTDYLRERGT